MISHNLSYFYLDSNAVSALWDLWTNYQNRGQTGDSILRTPFSEVVISDYTLDECLTIQLASNPYKKHLCMFLIYPQIKIMKPITIFDGKKSEHDASSISDLFHKKDYLQNVIALRASALVTNEARLSLEKDIENKKQGEIIAQHFPQFENKCNYADRLSLEDAIRKIIIEKNISPENSKYDFYQLCMNIFVAKRKRAIKGLEYKNSSRNLNEQIDSYHLSYLPYVQGFVTNDKGMTLLAKALNMYFGLGVKVIDANEYWELWVKNNC